MTFTKILVMLLSFLFLSQQSIYAQPIDNRALDLNAAIRASAAAARTAALNVEVTLLQEPVLRGERILSVRSAQRFNDAPKLTKLVTTKTQINGSQNALRDVLIRRNSPNIEIQAPKDRSGDGTEERRNDEPDRPSVVTEYREIPNLTLELVYGPQPISTEEDDNHLSQDAQLLDYVSEQVTPSAGNQESSLFDYKTLLPKASQYDVIYYRFRKSNANNEYKYSEQYEFVMPHPLVFGVLGDSFAAGEGAPNQSSSNYRFAVWDDRGAHRSNQSGFKRAINEFRAENLDLWIEARTWAISSSTAQAYTDAAGKKNDRKGGIVSDYQDGERELYVDGSPFPSPQAEDITVTGQLASAENWLVANGLSNFDIILLSIGGNDAGFGGVIRKAVSGTLSADNLQDVRENLNERLESAGEYIDLMGDELLLAARPEHVFWVNYPNMTRDENGRHSAVHVNSESENAWLVYLDGALEAEDMLGAETIITRDLNPTVTSWCGNKIDNCQIIDVEDSAANHGVNAQPRSERWFNTFGDSQEFVQGGVDGVVHPNYNGHGAYRDAIKSKLVEMYHPDSGTYFLSLNQVRSERNGRAIREAKLAAQQEYLRLFQELDLADDFKIKRSKLKQIQDSRKGKINKILKNSKQPRPLEEVIFPDGKITLKRISKKRQAEIIFQFKHNPKMQKELQDYYRNLEMKKWTLTKEDY